MNLLCFDFGGTFIKRGIVNEKMEIIPIEKVESRNDRQYALSQIVDLYNIISKTNEINGIAISMYGVVSNRAYLQAHFKSEWYHKFDLKTELSKLIPNLSIHLVNDGKAALLGAIWSGEVDKDQDHVAITIGTGIGGALWINKEITNGIDGASGHLGNFFRYDEQTEKITSYSDLHSMSSQLRRYRDLTGKEVDGETYFREIESASASIELKKIHNDWINRIGAMFVGFANAFNPATILVSGGVTDRVGFMESVKAAYNKWLKNFDYEWSTELKTLRFTNDSNLLGAAFNWINNEK